MKNRVFTKLLALLTCAAIICTCAVGCGKEKEDWVTGEPIGGSTTATTTPTTAPTTAPTQPDTSGAGLTESHPAPRFKSGAYTMISTVTNSETYADATGAKLYDASLMTRYTYRLDIAVGEEIVCKYTFKEIYGTSTVGSETVVGVNTADPALKTADTAVYYDIIGSSFTARAEVGGKLKSVEGISEICQAFPSATSILNEELMRTLAADLFYSMPDTFAADTQWPMVQYGIQNTCTAAELRDGRFLINITGGEIPLAEPTTDSDGFTTAYTMAEPLRGTIWMDSSDRAIQELSARQKTLGTLSDQNGNGAFFSLTAITVCTIEAAQ